MVILVGLVIVGGTLGVATLAAACAWPARRVIRIGAGLAGAVALASVGVGALGSPGGDGPPSSPSSGAAAATPEEGRGGPSLGRRARAVEVSLEAAAAGRRAFPPVAPLVAGLSDAATRLVAVRDSDDVTLHQCALHDGAVESCAPGVPATAGDEGVATGLVELRRELELGSRTVDCARQRCVLVALDDDAKVVAAADLGFGEPGARLRLAVRPSAGLEAGDAVDARISAAPAGSRATLRWCASPGPAEPGACDAEADSVVVRIGADGTGTARVVVPEGPVGDGRACRRGPPCALAVDIDRATPGALVLVDFAGPAGPDLDRGLLLACMAGALALVALAVVLHRSTDWTPPERDPFADTSLAVPEWEGVSEDVPEWDDLAPLGSGSGGYP